MSSKKQKLNRHLFMSLGYLEETDDFFETNYLHNTLIININVTWALLKDVIKFCNCLLRHDMLFHCANLFPTSTGEAKG